MMLRSSLDRFINGAFHFKTHHIETLTYNFLILHHPLLTPASVLHFKVFFNRTKSFFC